MDFYNPIRKHGFRSVIGEYYIANYSWKEEDIDFMASLVHTKTFSSSDNCNDLIALEYEINNVLLCHV